MATRRTPPGKSAAEYIAELSEPLRSEVVALRVAILDAVPGAGEDIKWNAPSFHLGEHFATMRLHGKVLLQLILHLGARSTGSIPRGSIDDPAGILQWLGPDRACIEFKEPGNVATHCAAVRQILQQWVRHVPAGDAGRQFVRVDAALRRGANQGAGDEEFSAACRASGRDVVQFPFRALVSQSR